MRLVLLTAASATALGLAACGPKAPPARAALDCPATQGELTRTSASPDGKICTYASRDGAEVTLQLVSVQGSVDSTLAGIEANLLAGRRAGTGSAPEGNSEKGESPAKPAEAAKDAEAAATDADKVVAQAESDANASGVQVSVDEHGTKVVAGSHGETHVNLPGVHIVANDDNDTANVQIGPLHVNAGDDKMDLRIRRDVRLRGEPLNPERRGFRAMFLYAGSDLPEGLRFVGYEAGGPKRGPFAVAVVKSKTDHHGSDEIYPDVKRLVRRNGGV